MPMTSVLYLYGFVPADAPAPPDTLAGIDGRPVRLRLLDGLAAVTSEVDSTAFGEAVIDARLKDLSWVGRQGASHEAVVTWFSDHATIVPARLLTLFSSEAALVAEAAERSVAIEEQLRRFRDVREWDLKVSYDFATLSDHLAEFSDEARRAEQEIEAAPPGRRYLLERRREESVKRETVGVARELGSDLLDRLRPVAEEVIELEPPTRRDDLPVVVNAALLVATDRADELRVLAAARIQGLEPRGVHVSLTGPWAPYRFLEGAARG